ncbi:VOC family protein [Streptomyces sp. ME01-24h]|nr:VOC family protein [Streptomyces sp. ME19-03-3]MDX3352258.1 VOC family protein [Streptomyces sp. ME01-24h]
MTEVGNRHPHGTPCWVSLLARSVEATQEFYSHLFGWEFHPGPRALGPNVRAALGERNVAGIGALPGDRHLPIAWTPYFAADDADKTAELIRICGGTVGVGPLDADDAGRVALASDPSGAVFGVWQARHHPGAEIGERPGGPVWHELVTRDTALAGHFYSAVFGLETEADVSSDLDHLTLHLAGRPVGGIRGVGRALPRDRGAHWMTYFEVADTDVAARRVLELGGSVIRTPRDGAYGRLATVADPEGAVFTVIRSRPQPAGAGTR